MPKPILSELEYNASDVASAILSSADLSVTNQDFGVTDRSSLFTAGTGWNFAGKIAYSFNGFMFVSLYCTHSGGSPQQNEVVLTMTDSDFYPTVETYFSSISYEGDSLTNLVAKTDGTFRINDVNNEGISTFYITTNGFYRFT